MPNSPSTLLACGRIWTNTPAAWWPSAELWNWVMAAFRATGRAAGPGPDSPRGRRTTRVDVQRSRPGTRFGRHGRAHGARRPAVAPALDLQERPHACGGTDGPAPP